MTADRTDQLKLELERETPFRADDFIVSDCNRAAALTLAGWPDAAAGLGGGVLSLCGPAGSGKSHLAAIWAERVGAMPLHGAEAALVDPMELEGRPVLLDRAPDTDDEALFHLLNLAQTGGGALLLVSRKAPSLWPVTLPDLHSRLNAIRTVVIEEPDEAVLAAILERAFERRSIRPQPDVIPYLVRRIERSAQAAEAAVARLDALHRPVTRRLAARVMDDLGS
ncbi:chromosomal replication initiator DnaA [Brevundimonas sp. BAL450]|uniref:DnaA ATPase domain-containing protein n=1 Tax=Brevundimonas TaxID=41275 RepID=UPI0018CA4249|nr:MULTISPECIES: DnaA/Hda family protein [Brevundimonas]MBG7615798.1 chromosomal replication initiator DnaA [Brevundimonas sp. BAL450]